MVPMIINPFRFAGPAGPAAGWKEVARTTLGSDSTTIDVSGIPDKRYYIVLLHYLRGGTNQCGMRFNNDSGSNYARRYNYNGNADSTGTSETGFDFTGNASSSNNFAIFFIANEPDKEKLVSLHVNEVGPLSSSFIGDRREQVAKWANTSNAINQITAICSASTYASGSEMVVLGYDPDDTHTENFWEELADVTLGSDSAQISSGTITAKKYLWFQTYFQSASNSNDVLVQFNNDTGNNYSMRHAINYGSDVQTVTSPNIRLTDRNGGADQGRYTNSFVINKSDEEKGLITHGCEEETSGAVNPPTVNQCVSKWSCEPCQITEIDCFTDSGNIRAGARLKVWGSD